jgi:excisionase family DNA binding protein
MTRAVLAPARPQRDAHLAAGTSIAPLMDVQGVSEVLNVTPRHIQRLVAERRIPYLKVGRFVRFDPGELNMWLEDQRVTALRSAGWARRNHYSDD